MYPVIVDESLLPIALGMESDHISGQGLNMYKTIHVCLYDFSYRKNEASM